MKKRLDNYLAAVMERNNKLELILNALWLVPWWIALRIVSTFKQGINVQQLANLFFIATKYIIVSYVLFGIGFALGRGVNFVPESDIPFVLVNTLFFAFMGVVTKMFVEKVVK